MVTITTVGEIFREYKPWIVILITQWSKLSKILALSLCLFDLQGLLPFIIRCTEVEDTPKALDVLWWYSLSNETIGFFVAFSLLKKANFLPILQKNAKYNNNLWEKCLSSSSKVHVAERKILQVRYLTYRWLFYKVHLLPPEKWQQNKIQSCYNGKRTTVDDIWIITRLLSRDVIVLPIHSEIMT
jgi:hypothetical protein